MASLPQKSAAWAASPDGRRVCLTAREATLPRRAALAALLGAFAASLAWPSWGGTRASAQDTAETELRRWLRSGAAAALGDAAALRRLGEFFLAAHPEEAGALPSLLAADRRVPLSRQWVGAIARDWRTLDVVVVDGWLLSRTEARICAALRLYGSAAA